jgi:hypothetical protein
MQAFILKEGHDTLFMRTLSDTAPKGQTQISSYSK